MSPAKVLENLWIVNNLMTQLQDVGLSLQAQTSDLSYDLFEAWVFVGI
jgi:hypothetical protein